MAQIDFKALAAVLKSLSRGIKKLNKNAAKGIELHHEKKKKHSKFKTKLKNL